MLLIPKIKNMEYPICKNCKHFIPHKDISFSRCSFFGTKDVVTGEIVYKYADLTRNDGECGVSGKYYETIKD